MSSVVRKSSHFTPKVKKRPLRKSSISATPPSTQAGEAPASKQVFPPEETQDIEDVGPKSTIPAELTPPPTQDDRCNSISVSSAQVDGSDGSNNAEKGQHFLPVDANSDEEDYGDNDIFKKPFMEERQRRRSSVASHRRLSGLGNFKRSISAAPGPPGTEWGAVSPVSIAVPVSKPSKKRRQSISSKTSKVPRNSIMGEPENSLLQELGNDGNKDAIRVKAESNRSVRRVDFSSDVTVGICPVTNKLRKFRTSENAKGYNHLPVAPPDLVTTVTDIKQIPKKIDISDEVLFSKIHVLTENLSLAELCKPTIKIGTTTENFNKARQALVKIAARREERRVARIMAREKKISYEKALKMVQGDLLPQDGPQKLDFLGLPEDEETSGTTVQLSLVGGKLQVYQESTVLTRNPTTSNRNREVEIENPFENPVLSSSYTKVTHTDAWRHDEMVQLYKALSTWGTNFTFISQLFPHRTRRQVKRKFAAEEKKNPQLVELALRRKLPLNIDDYVNALPEGESLKSIDDFQKEMEKVQKEHQKLIEEIKLGRERAMKEDLEKKEHMIREIGGDSKREEKQNLRRSEVVIGTVDDIDVKRSRNSMEN